MKITLRAHHIIWETDTPEQALGLPRKVEVEIDLSDQEGFSDINDQICDQLSNMTGWCVLEYRLEGYSAEADYALQMRNAQSQDK